MESLGCATLAHEEFQFIFALRTGFNRATVTGSSTRRGPAPLIETALLKSLFAVQAQKKLGSATISRLRRRPAFCSAQAKA
jgi:hypothetical protein